MKKEAFDMWILCLELFQKVKFENTYHFFNEKSLSGVNFVITIILKVELLNNMLHQFIKEKSLQMSEL